MNCVHCGKEIYRRDEYEWTTRDGRELWGDGNFLICDGLNPDSLWHFPDNNQIIADLQKIEADLR